MRNDGEAYCDCIDPMYNGTYCDNYICAGYCLNGGMCFPIYDQTIQPIILKCSCRHGFEGDRCQIPSDCNCAHNATCSKDPTTGTQSCICPPGFQGDKCEECASNEVCLNEGQCIADQHGNFRCNCAPGFHGPLCQYRLCDSFGPCQNGGTCIATTKGPQCQCPADYKGPYCSTYICEDYCLHGGVPTGKIFSVLLTKRDKLSFFFFADVSALSLKSISVKTLSLTCPLFSLLRHLDRRRLSL